MVFEEVTEATGVGDFLTGQLLEFVLRFSIESFFNTLQALMWPAYIARFEPPYGPIILGAMFVLFPMTLKKPLERWLFPESHASADTADVATANSPDSAAGTVPEKPTSGSDRH